MQQNPAVELPISDIPIGVSHGWRQPAGRLLIAIASLVLAALLALQLFKTFGLTSVGFDNWRPVAVTFVGWAVCLCAGIVWTRGQRGEQAVFLLPAVLITLAFVISPRSMRCSWPFTIGISAQPPGDSSPVWTI